MTDTTVAPQGGAPAAAPASEVPITQNPVAAPTPVGSQAPEAPVGDVEGSRHRPESRRESIQRAFERASQPPPQADRRAAKPAPKPAEAKPGHNNPPPEDKIDLRRRPTTAPAGDNQAQPRDQGRFAPRNPQGDQVSGQARPAPQPGQQQRRPAPPPLPANAPFRDPPVRMDENAKADWPATPESVRGNIHRIQQEFGRAYQYYKADAEAMQPIKRFHEMAQSHGTTLERALTNYVSMEQKLRADPVGGLDLIVHNLNLKTADGQRLGLRDIAYHVLSQSPDQLRAIQQGNNQQAAQHQIGALHQEVAGLKQALNQMHTAQQFTYTRSAVDQFADSHPRFDELGDLIENELKFGFDLETAYRRAELLRPTTHAAQTRTASAQTRPSDKSISGAPGAASNGAAHRPPKEASRSPREAVANAIRRVNGSY
jgi:hypothetical protein